MNIFYYSIHQILEADEINLFHSLGHHVFSLGMNSACGTAQPFRDEPKSTPVESELHSIYRRLHGQYRGRKLDEIVPRTFIDHFSAAIIMHDVSFLEDMWSRLRSRLVIWRSIGQGVDHYEDRLRPLRAEGLRIVRYSEVEREISGSVGQDAIIRFGKDPARYGGWIGGTAQVLTFSNHYADRYPLEARDWIAITEGFPTVLGGFGNEGMPAAIGFATEQAQAELYRASRVYLYASGLDIPYTLNFMEAWMTGIPVVFYRPPARAGRWLEIDRIICHGETGYVCDSTEEARGVIQNLLQDHQLAARIGAAGQQEAIRLFSNERAARQWNSILRESS